MWILSQNKKMLTNGIISFKVVSDVDENFQHKYYIILKNLETKSESIVATYLNDINAYNSLIDLSNFFNKKENNCFKFPQDN